MKVYRYLSLLIALSLALSGVFAVPPNSVFADTTAQTLPFTQDWTNTALITAIDDWSGVPGVMGYRGDGLTAANDVDPQTVLGDDSPGVVDVNANQTNPDSPTSPGGVTEFELANPVIALAGSGTADAPYILVNLNTTGKTNIQVAYNVRDVDGSADNAAQQVALHYRVGATGPWTNVPAAYIADATEASTATKVTPISVTLPAAADNQAQVQIRVMTTNAGGSDEGVGIDDLSVTEFVVEDIPPTVTTTVPAAGAMGVAPDANLTVTFSEAVTAATGWYSISCATSNAHTAVVSGGPTVFTINPDADFANSELCTITLESTLIADQDGTANLMAANYVWDFTTVSTDAPPTVVTTSPATGATGVAYNSNITIDFSEPVTTTASFFDISCGISGAHTVAASGGPTSYTLDPAADFLPGETCTATVQNDQVTDQDGTPDPMAADYVWTFTAAAATAVCGEPYIPIHTIQGSGPISPITGTVVTEGIVTAVFQATATDLNGFYIQAIPGTEDANPLTSEGVFVYHSTLSSTVGNIVRVQGTVGTYANQTQLTSPSILATCSTGNALPAKVVVDLPDVADAAFSLEAYEGMLVSITEPLTVQQNFFQGRYGQVTLGAGGRIPQIHNVTKYTGTDPFYQFTRMIILDDASTGQNPNPISYYPADDFMRSGDIITGITGIVDQGPINTSTSSLVLPLNWYRLQPTAPIVPANITRANPRTATPPVVGGRLKIVGTNVLNYFPTLDMAPYRSTFPYNGGTNTPRGADSAAEFTRQQDKLVAALAAENGDVYTLMEIESWDGAADGIGAPQALANALNTFIGTPGLYAVVADPALGYFDPATDGGDFIQVAILYKTTTVTPVGVSVSSNDAIFDRSPFAQEFEEISTGEQFVVVANHFKSKGSCPASGADADQGDGQGCWNAKRMLQSAALLDLIETSLLPLDTDVFVMGDLNSYGAEDPITVLTDGGLVNQIAAFVPAAERYSYVFDGTAGYLDHALSTASATAQITDVTFWHINADEPVVIDYNTEFKPVDLYQTHQYKSSDHDPVIIGLNLTAPSITWADDSWAALPNGSEVTPAFPAASGTHIIGYDAFDTIQEAVTAVTAGGTTYVVDGTYTEALYLFKEITLTGAGSATTIVKAPATLPSYTWNSAMNPLVGVDRTTAYISGFTFDGDGKGDGAGQFVGVHFWSSNGSLTDSVLIGMRDATFSGVQDGTAVLVNHDYDVNYPHTVLIQNNQISDYQKAGIVVNELAAEAQILGNTITGHGPTPVTAQNGIQVGYGAIATIADNDVSGNAYTGESWSAAGVLLVGVDGVIIADNNIHENQQGITVGYDAYYGYGGSTDTLVTANTIVNNDFGVAVDDVSDTGLVMHYNRIFGNTTGVDNVAPDALAENNWWGCNAGPNDVAGDCDTFTGTGVIDADPWLVLSASFDPLDLQVGTDGTLLADLLLNSAAVDTSADGFVPDTTPALFTATNGSFVPAADTFFSGDVNSLYTAPAVSGPDSACIDVDNEKICFALAILDPLAVTDLDLRQSADATATKPWALVPGSYAAGFEMPLDPTVAFHYLDTDTITSNRPLADGFYPFFVDSYPAGFLAYWAARGVDGTPPYAEPWQPYMWEIISGDEPIFLLKVVGSDYTLLDGLTYNMSSGAVEEPLKINGDYLPGAYTFSGIVADEFGLTADVAVDILFNDIPTATAQTVTTAEDTAVGITLAGVDLYPGTLTYTFVQPSNGTLSGTAPALTYTPDADYSGSDSFTFTVSDGTLTSAEATVSITVTAVNDAPVLATIGDQTVNELVELTFIATATDIDSTTLFFDLTGTVPAGAAITTDGVFTWTPAEDQDGEHTFTVRVCDDATTPLCDTEEITVTVAEVNVAPVLGTIGDQSVNELVELAFTATATDADDPIQPLTFSLTGAPTGAAITTDGDFTWTPTEAQDGEYTFDVCVSDGALSDCETITVTVAEVNVAPVLATIGDQTVNELVELAFTATATDVDDPIQPLTFSLTGAPTGAAITADGDFTWTPTEAQDGEYTFDVCVSDGALSGCETITVTVNEANVAPVAPVIDDVEWLARTAHDYLIPAFTDADGNTLTYTATLLDGSDLPAWLSFDPTTLTFSGTPANGDAGAYEITVTASDGLLDATASFTLTVTVNPIRIFLPIITR